MGRDSVPCEGSRPGEHPPAARDTLCLRWAQVGAVGAHGWMLRAVGTLRLVLCGTGRAGRTGRMSPRVLRSHRHRVCSWGLCRAGA